MVYIVSTWPKEGQKSRIPTIWARAKQRWQESEKKVNRESQGREEEKKKDKRREGQKKEDAGARTGRKSRSIVFSNDL